MSRKKLVRRQNFHLLMAGGLNIALLFAPLAYAVNVVQEVYGRLHGSWLWLITETPAGRNTETIPFWGDWAMALYTILVVGAGITLLYLIFYQQNLKKKRLILWVLLGVMAVQILLALLRQSQLLGYLADGGPDDLSSQLEAQFWLHIFPIIFAFRALTGVRKDIKQAESPSQSAE